MSWRFNSCVSGVTYTPQRCSVVSNSRHPDWAAPAVAIYCGGEECIRISARLRWSRRVIDSGSKERQSRDVKRYGSSHGANTQEGTSSAHLLTLSMTNWRCLSLHLWYGRLSPAFKMTDERLTPPQNTLRTSLVRNRFIYSSALVP